MAKVNYKSTHHLQKFFIIFGVFFSLAALGIIVYSSQKQTNTQSDASTTNQYRRIRFFADLNQDGVITGNEVNNCNGIKDIPLSVVPVSQSTNNYILRSPGYKCIVYYSTNNPQRCDRISIGRSNMTIIKSISGWSKVLIPYERGVWSVDYYKYGRRSDDFRDISACGPYNVDIFFVPLDILI